MAKTIYMERNFLENDTSGLIEQRFDVITGKLHTSIKSILPEKKGKNTKYSLKHIFSNFGVALTEKIITSVFNE